MGIINEIGEEKITEISQEIIGELNYNEWNYTTLGVDKVIETWSERKKNLFDILSKHPKFLPDKLMIQFDCKTERKLDTYIIGSFYENLCRKFNLRYTPNTRYCPHIFYLNIKEMTTPYITTNTADYLNTYFKCTHFREGQKTSRVVNKIYELLGKGCDSWFNKEFARFSDAITPKETARHMCLSIHPMDYLLMSNGNSWSSCHSIITDNGEEPGCHCSGTISYMLDETSMILYEVEEFDSSPQTLPKIIRQVVNFNGEILVTNRLYPQNMDSGANTIYEQLNEIVRKVLSECYLTKLDWIKEDTPRNHDREHFIYHKGTAYPDWVYMTQTQIWRTTGDELPDPINIGAYPICIECGREHDLNGSITCCSAAPNSNRWQCDCCGDYFDEDDVYWSDYENEYLCGDCSVWCEILDDYIREGREIYTDSHGDFVPQSEIDNGTYVICEECGAIVWYQDIETTKDGYKICIDCYEDDSITYECDCCGEVYMIDKTESYSVEDDEIYCEECYQSYCESLESQILA